MSLELALVPSKQGNADTGVVAQTRNDIATRFRPGQSGNPGGRPRTAILRRAALKHLKLAVAGKVTQLDCVVDSTIQTAIEGGSAGVAAFCALRDTVDGKPGQEHATANIGIAVSVEIVGSTE